MKIMVMGAGGLCGTSLIPMIGKLFPEAELFLIDSSEEVNPPIIRTDVKIDELWFLLHSFKMGDGDILIDLTTELCKVDVMQIADSAKVSCINATCCEKDRGSLSLVDLLDKNLLLARYKWQASHIAGAGMNPGNINALLTMMVERFGNPLDVTEWEMDSTIPFHWDGEGFATWSPAEFASEFSDESTFEVNGKGVVFADGPPIDNLVKMPDGNKGALCQHEELLKWGWEYGCVARYLYGYPPESMEAITKNIKDGLDLPLCRKLKGRTPSGKDTIGLHVEFESGEADAYITASNDDESIPVGSNATSYLVACGICAAINMLMSESNPGLHWPDEYGSKWIGFLRDENLCEVRCDGD